jgi:hypothetical protein
MQARTRSKKTPSRRLVDALSLIEYVGRANMETVIEIDNIVSHRTTRVGPGTGVETHENLDRQKNTPE